MKRYYTVTAHSDLEPKRTTQLGSVSSAWGFAFRMTTVKGVHTVTLRQIDADGDRAIRIFEKGRDGWTSHVPAPPEIPDDVLAAFAA